MKSGLIARFAFAFALLLVFGALAVAAFIKVLVTPAPNNKSITRVEAVVNPTDAELKEAACAYQIQGAAQEGIFLTYCEVVHESKKGNQATLKLELHDKDTKFIVLVQMQKSGWQVQQWKVVSNSSL